MGGVFQLVRTNRPFGALAAARVVSLTGDMLGRVFGNLYGAVGVAAALSYVGGSLLLDATSPPVTLVVAGGLGTIATVATALALKGKVRSGQ